VPFRGSHHTHITARHAGAHTHTDTQPFPFSFHAHTHRESVHLLGRAASEEMPTQEQEDARDTRLASIGSVRNREREHVRKMMAADARDKCDEPRAAYVECARGRTISLPFMCRSLFKELNACVSQYTSDAEFERRLQEFSGKQAQ
jgi:COX assembly protein 1